MNDEPVVIIGAGIAGLAAAYELVQNNVRAVVLEAQDEAGGLAGSMTIGGERADRYYHFICGNDDGLLELVKETGLEPCLNWAESTTGYFQKNKIYPFSRPFDLIGFDILPLMDRFKFGMNVLECRFRQKWDDLDKITASEWLGEKIGKKAYHAIWKPLLREKFGKYYKEISAAWIWHRINRVASSRKYLWQREKLGYLQGGTEVLIKRLIEIVTAKGGRVETGRSADGIIVDEVGYAVGICLDDGTIQPASSVISTIPAPELVRLFKYTDCINPSAIQKMKEIPYINIICVVMLLKRKLTDYFWLNVNAEDIPFSGVIEFSNLNQDLGDGKHHIIYIPFYVADDDPLWSTPNEKIIESCIFALERIQPEFTPGWIREVVVCRDRNVQPICGINFKGKMFSMNGPVGGLYITDSSRLYPEDRTISGMIKLGREAAKEIISKSEVK